VATSTYQWQPGATPLQQTNDSIIAGDQFQAAIGANASGTGFFATWTDPVAGLTVEGRLMHADGTPQGSQFKINAASAGAHTSPSVAGLADGRYITVFTDTGNDPSGDIVARLFNADGSPAGNDFVITNSVFADVEPHVTGLADGGYVVTWTRGFGGNDLDVRAAVYNADGTVRDALINVTNSAATAERHSSVAALANGGFVVAWEQAPVGGGNTEVRVARFDANGQPLDPSGGVVIDSSGSINKDIQILGLADGGFVAAYTDNGWGVSGTEITVHIFNADGSARTSYLMANDAANGGKTFGDQAHPSLALLSNGYFAVNWNDTTTHVEYLQAYDTQGNAIGQNKVVLGNSAEAEIAGLGHGSVAMLSDSLIPDGSGNSIQSKTYQLVHVVTGDASNEVIQAGESGLRETIDGKDGDDTVTFFHDLASYQVTDFGKYIDVVRDGATTRLSNIEHLQFTDGTIDVNDGSALFDTVYYMSHNLDVFHAHANALAHFNASGWHEGRDPNGFFSVNGYLATNPDVKANGTNPLDHYDQTGWHEGRDPSANFDTKLYLMHNPDVAAAGVDPLQHYLQNGMAEGRQAYQAIGTAASGFDAEYYLLHNPDVAASGMDPLAHFNQYGWHEGRNPNAWFDTKGYLAHYGDVAAANINPLQHYEQSGWLEGRDPSAGFDTLKYLAANPDVAGAHINPLDHFINSGIYEGRVAINDGMFH
jgi:hypothetical protein